jgi:molybdopterin molybdotransferase
MSTLASADAARALFASFGAVGTCVCALDQACGRVLGADVIAGEPLPAFARAVMDGYALRASDAAGASEDAPAYLHVVGQVPMGRTPEWPLGPGQAAEIATGGMLPQHADAVVMVEHTERMSLHEVAVRREVQPGANVAAAGDDVAVGACVLARGRTLSPADVGLLAALGVCGVPVYRRPRVTVISTGGEIVPPEQKPAAGQVRDVNQAALAAAAARLGADVRMGGIVPDDAQALVAAVGVAAGSADLVLVSGGSSVGERDLTAQALGAVGEILLAGIAVRPGKPTLLARGPGGQALCGMPGPPAAALVIFDVFIRGLLARQAGVADYNPWPAQRRARLTHKLASVTGREDWVRVRLTDAGAEPLTGGSTVLSNLSRSDGYVCVDARHGDLAQGDEVTVLLHT